MRPLLTRSGLRTNSNLTHKEAPNQEAVDNKVGVGIRPFHDVSEAHLNRRVQPPRQRVTCLFVQWLDLPPNIDLFPDITIY